MPLNPEVKEIRFTTDLHNKCLQMVRSRRRLSEQKLQDRRAQWASAEDRFLAYLKVSEIDQKRNLERSQGIPHYTTIEIPFSLAMLLTAHTYWSSIFLGRTPVMQYSARSGGPAMNEQAVEAIVDYQVMVGEMLIPLYIWLMDAGKYGVGIIGSYWADEQIAVTRTVEEPVMLFNTFPTGKVKTRRVTERLPWYMGNKLFNVRPQDFYHDPRVSMHRFQEGEFCGRVTHVGWNSIKRGVANGSYFNIEELKNNLTRRYLGADYGGSTLKTPQDDDFLLVMNADDSELDRAYIELMEMTIELDGRELGLSQESYPEKWIFTIANDCVIIGCQPLGEDHGKFPFDVLEYETEGYGLSKRSLLEIAEPLNNTLTWLFNSHMYNVRKVVNDMLIVDPSRVVMKDLLDPDAGKIIRLKEDAYGTDVRSIVSQLNVVDVTQGHLRDSQVVMDMMQRLLGVTDQVMGMMAGGGRKTAAEVRTSSGFGVNRLKTNSEYFSAMGFGPLSQKLLQRTQQNYTEELEFKIAGDLIRDKAKMRVSPDMIAGFFDFVPVDGTMPVDKFALANLWKELIMGAAKMGMGQMYDIPAMFGWVAQLSGVKNFDRFRIKVQPDEALAQQAQAGNVVPLGGQGGQGGAERNFNAIPQSGATSGVGKVA